MSKQWQIGDWAEEAEREEAEEKERRAASAAAIAAASSSSAARGESHAARPKKKKQSLYEFISTSATSRSGSISAATGLTPDEMLLLPTGPRTRSGEEDAYGRGLGRAFRDYQGEAPDRYDRSSFGAPYEQNREVGSFVRDRGREEPSRADESSSWSSSKRDFSSGGGHAARVGYAGERRPPRSMDVQEMAPFRADDADKWVSAKKPLPMPLDAHNHRLSRREGSMESRHSRADEVDNWSRGKTVAPAPTGFNSSTRQSGSDTSRWGRRDQEHVSLVSRNAGDTGELVPSQLAKPKTSPFGSAKPREKVLLERSLDGLRLDSELVHKEGDSRPSSSHASRPALSESTAEPVSNPRSKVNPFGDAKPREVLLEERGKDWRKMDFELEHRGVDRPETEEELRLKEEINLLIEHSKKEAEPEASRATGGPLDEHSAHNDGNQQDFTEQIRVKEMELEQLVRTLDDKVRFSQKVAERPGSQSGRSDVSGRADSRPGSRSGRSDTGRGLERPGSLRGYRSFDSAERPSGFQPRPLRSLESVMADRPRSRGGWGEGSGNHEAVERTSSWAGANERGRSFESLARSRSRMLPANPGPGVDYLGVAGPPDIWTRSNESGGDRRGDWGIRR